MVPLTTDANGNAAVLFVPNPTKGVWIAESIDPLTLVATMPLDGQGYAGLADFGSSARQARLVSGGVKLASITSLSNSQGYFLAKEFTPVQGQNNYFTTIELGTMAETTVAMRPVRDPGSLYGLFKPTGPTAREFAPQMWDPLPDSSNVSSSDWSCLLFTVTGAAASSTVAVLTYSLHWEFTFTQGSALNRLAPAPVPPNGFLTRASNYVSSRVSTFIAGNQVAVEKSVMDAASSYARSAFGFAANRILPGSGSAMLALTNGMEVD